MKIRKIVRTALLISAIIFVAGSVIGTLATPIILSIYFTWYWLFIYSGYLLITLYVILYCVRYCPSAEVNRRK